MLQQISTNQPTIQPNRQPAIPKKTTNGQNSSQSTKEPSSELFPGEAAHLAALSQSPVQNRIHQARPCTVTDQNSSATRNSALSPPPPPPLAPLPSPAPSPSPPLCAGWWQTGGMEGSCPEKREAAVGVSAFSIGASGRGGGMQLAMIFLLVSVV